MPLLLGLTGGIGSGKSTIAKILETINIPVFNSDVEAKYIVDNDASVIDQITAEFGDLYNRGKVDKVKLSALVFKDKQALEKLNSIVHPKVKEYFDNWVEQRKNQPILVKEAAILIESGAYKQVDKIILVEAPEKLRIRRVMKRDAVSEKKVRERIAAQMSDADKLRYADFTIANNEEELIIPQVLEVISQIKKALIY